MNTMNDTMKLQPPPDSPTPPMGMQWEYRGLGWSNGGHKTTYFTARSNGTPAHSYHEAHPCGAVTLHYFEAVPETTKPDRIVLIPGLGLNSPNLKIALPADNTDDIEVLTDVECGQEIRQSFTLPAGARIIQEVPEGYVFRGAAEGPFTYRGTTVPDSAFRTDPKGEAGKLKCPLHLLPPVAMEEAAKAHALGAERYGPWNWRETRVCASTYIGAIMRHLNAFREGENLDPESGASHLGHIIAGCGILLDAAKYGTLEDDRP